jgi:hypothetical protein
MNSLTDFYMQEQYAYACRHAKLMQRTTTQKHEIVLLVVIIIIISSTY